MRNVFGSLAAVCFLWGCGQSDEASVEPADRSAGRLSGQVAEMARDLAMSGVVLIARDGEPILVEAFNVEPLRADFEVSVDSVFSVASLTKSFTAVLALRQVERGRINLDDPIRVYLPALKAAYADDVTVRQLLQNRSGIPHYVDIPGWFDPEIKNAFTAESFLSTISTLELRFEPGKDYYYSNVNYYLLGLILEAASGESYEALLHYEILKPLSLHATGQTYSPGSQAVAPTYLRDGDNYEQIIVSNLELFRATGSLYSSARDLFLFGQGIMKDALLGNEMREILLDPDRPMAFTIASASLAGQEVPVITYNGELAGATSMLTMFPEQDGTIVILSNNNKAYSDLVEMTLAFAQTAFAGR